jgi:hypothetical protein
MNGKPIKQDARVEVQRIERTEGGYWFAGQSKALVFHRGGNPRVLGLKGYLPTDLLAVLIHHLGEHVGESIEMDAALASMKQAYELCCTRARGKGCQAKETKRKQVREAQHALPFTSSTGGS